MRQGCAQRGAHPVFPYVNGALEVLSAPLVRYVATSEFIETFVRRNSTVTMPTGREKPRRRAGSQAWQNQGDDVALGFWLSLPVLKATPHAPPDVSYVRINDRATNVACVSTAGLYQRPRRDSRAVHFVKRPSGMQYIWKLLHDGEPHDPKVCARHVWGRG